MNADTSDPAANNTTTATAAVETAATDNALSENALSENAGLIPAMSDIASFLEIGGPVVWLLLAMSVLVLTILLIKIVQFLMCGLLSPTAGRNTDRIVRLWESGQLDTAGYGQLRASSTATGIVYKAIDYVSHQRLQGPALVTELKRMLDKYQRSLSSLLGTLELVGSLAPLLGLLGTVIGMIEAFQAMQAAGTNVDPSVLSGGIWKALLTTAVGLGVAIPAIIVHNWLGQRVDNHVAAIGDRVTRVLTTANTYHNDAYGEYRES